MKMDAGMDTGDVLEIHETPIGADETAGELSARMSKLGGDVVREGLPRFMRGELAPKKQNDADATTAPLLEKEMGRVDWSQPAQKVHDHVRGMNPWPMAHTLLGEKRVIVHRTKMVTGALAARAAKAGTVVLADKSRVVVACSEGHVTLERVQLEGRKAVTGAELFLGRGIAEGNVLG